MASDALAWLRGKTQRPVPGEYVPVGRGRLLKAPHRPSDDCAAFEEGSPGAGECMSDGHYLCLECKHMSPESLCDRLGEKGSRCGEDPIDDCEADRG